MAATSKEHITIKNKENNKLKTQSRQRLLPLNIKSNQARKLQ